MLQYPECSNLVLHLSWLFTIVVVDVVVIVVVAVVVEGDNNGCPCVRLHGMKFKIL